MVNYADITAQPEYDIQFWNAMRNKNGDLEVLNKGRDTATGTFKLPAASSNKMAKSIEKESLFRGISTVIPAYGNGYSIFAKDCKDRGMFVPEAGEIPITDGMKDYTEVSVKSYKLASFIKLDEDFVHDAKFDIEKATIERFGKVIAKTEDASFVTGTGVNEPTGILHETSGAEVGVTTGELTYDSVVELFFSVDSEYRKNAVWMINDKTALTLRKLKDADGNYIWNQSNDTILGKPVLISNDMPDIGMDNKPIAFGDFSYYWIIPRKTPTVRTLTEQFTIYDQICYLAIEYLDAKSIRREAIKVIQIKNV